MLELTHGDLLTADAEALVNPVNCVGVMGAGLALQFKRAFPQNFAAYQSACAAGQMQPGTMLVHDTGALSGPRWIVNFPTKRHWREVSRLEDVEAGLLDLAVEIERRGIRSIAVPALGCGLGGLNWQDVRPRIESAFIALPEVRVLLFEPAAGMLEVRRT
jgi:O-acetyl-ADP-ribose deacetylase (regulator of RNase III)